MNRTTSIIIVVFIVLGLEVAYYFTRQPETPLIGGDRDVQGCLVAAGYSFSEEVGACVRSFEMTPDIIEAAQIAVEHVGRGYALTVTSFNSYEEVGAYDIILERGAERERKSIYIRNGKVAESNTVKLFYYNQSKDRDATGNIRCSSQGLVAIEREIPKTQTPIQDAIRLLLSSNLTEQERAQGISTEYPLAGFSLVGASLTNGVLTLKFDDPQNRTVGGACRVGIIWSQIESTARQFPEVTKVKFIPEELFQP